MTASITSMCSFGYKIMGEKTIGINAWDFPNWKKDVNDDREICKIAREVISSADAIVSFNGKKFDFKFIQTRLAIHGMELLHAVPHIDLCTITRSNFFLLNGRLKTVAKYLLDDSKLEHEGWPLWVKVHGGVNRVRDREAEKLMGKYNLKDVDLMVPLFKRFRPLIKNIPNYNQFVEGARNLCPSCGGTRLIRQGYQRSKVRMYARYKCNDCGSWSRSDNNDKDTRSV